MSKESIELLEQITSLKSSLTDLAKENANLRVQRDLAVAKMRSLLPIATPEQEAEMQEILATGIRGGLADLIRELELAS